MTVVRVNENQLVLFSVAAAEDATFAAVEALGEVAVIVVTSEHHTSYGAAWAARFPEAVVVGPGPMLDVIREREHVPVTAAAEDVLPAVGIDVVTAPEPACKGREQVYTFAIDGLDDGAASRAMLLGSDLVVNWQADETPFADLWGFEGLGRARLFSVIGIPDHAAWARFVLDQLEAHDDVDVVMFGHGPPIVGDDARATVVAAVSSPTGQIRANRASTFLVQFAMLAGLAWGCIALARRFGLF